MLEIDQFYKNFNYWGYPSDAYAVHFVKEKPGFSFYLQFLITSMIILFVLMGFILLYYIVFEDTRKRQSIEYMQTLDLIQKKHEQMRQMAEAPPAEMPLGKGSQNDKKNN
ncbi:UNKNOWN [Stylonychia lemnae]|uniref:Uncharacterized protein n=1 Tax=Stylonychia lemnae TaxID=5949 RepID=A0A078AZA4_STYLE|nr:UNKNOWN [Stylonychia lemnae]|eukprot:CDW87775.1 UNKNOWN [Stylonychia lemnae]